MAFGFDPAIPDPFRSALDSWSTAALTAQVLWARSLGPAAIAASSSARFDALTRFARAHSPFYRAAWNDLHGDTLQLGELPVVTKRTLMAAFDDWCTDREVNRDRIAEFLAERTQIGERFRGRYIVWTSSGSTGEPGVFVQDAGALATYDALVAAQLAGPGFAPAESGPTR